MSKPSFQIYTAQGSIPGVLGDFSKCFSGYHEAFMAINETPKGKEAVKVRRENPFSKDYHSIFLGLLYPVLEYTEGWFLASILKLDHVSTIFTFMTKENRLEGYQDVPLEVDMGNHTQIYFPWQATLCSLFCGIHADME